MRICLVSYEFPPGGGGEASYLCNLATGLSRLGHEVLVLTPETSSVREYDDYPFKVMGVKSRKGPIHELGFLGGAEVALTRLVQDQRIDIVHVTFDYPSFFVRLAKRGVPCVATVHHLHLVEALAKLYYESSALRNIPNLVKASILTRLENSLVRQCTSIIAISEFTAGTLIKYLKTPPEKIRTVRNGLDSSSFERGNGRRFQSRFQGVSDKAVAYVGRLEPSKGLDYLIPAFARVVKSIPDASLVIVGTGKDWYVNKLKASTASNGVADKVVFTGRIPQPLLPHAYAASKLTVLPSFMEGFGISLVESMASARPCVATRTGAIPEIVRHGETGLLVRPGNVEELGGAMTALLSDDGRAKRLGERGRAFVKTELTLEKMTASTLSVYERLV